MATVNIYLSIKRGGTQSFGEVQEALSWLRSQTNIWQIQKGDGKNDEVVNFCDIVVAQWTFLFNQLEFQSSDSETQNFEYQDDSRLIVHGSPVFSALIWVANHLPPESFRAAEVPAQIWADGLDWNDVKHVAGALSYEQKLRDALDILPNSDLPDEEGRISDLEYKIYAFAERIEMLRADVGAIEAKAGNIVKTYAESIKQIEITVEGTSDAAITSLMEVKKIGDDASAQAEASLNQIKEDAKNFLDALNEQAKLEKPIDLWESRATKHEATTTSRRKWMVGIGIGGLPIGCFISIIALLVARLVFTGSIYTGSQELFDSSAAMHDTFRYELIFASAVTLAYFTMYLWAMRLLVRLYSTEHHLGIDANGRAALAETYLSFTSSGDATKADRAIMLANLFRPVIDGMVKDEGPPAVSPAAFISSIASASRR